MSGEANAPLRIAVLINPRAARVSTRLLRTLGQYVEPTSLYLCEQPRSLNAHLNTILSARYDVIACAGGDGTIAAVLERLCQHPASPAGPMPYLAALPLGTGNALAHWVSHASLRQNLRALRQLRQNTPPATRTLRLVRAGDGHRFFFGGLGIDSLVLAHYNQVRRSCQHSPWLWALRGLGGYGWAVMRHTLPQLRKSPLPVRARVYTLEHAHYFAAQRGDAPLPVAAGSCLWDGPLSLLAVGTTPTFGYGLRMFPFAEQLTDGMQLRLAALPPQTVLRHLPKIWRGTCRHPGIHDFAVRHIRITLAAPFGWQTSGDERGTVQALTLRAADERFELLDLRRAATTGQTPR